MGYARADDLVADLASRAPNRKRDSHAARCQHRQEQGDRFFPSREEKANAITRMQFLEVRQTHGNLLRATAQVLVSPSSGRISNGVSMGLLEASGEVIHAFVVA